MPITIRCPQCRKPGKVPDEFRNASITCKRCKYSFVLTPQKEQLFSEKSADPDTPTTGLSCPKCRHELSEEEAPTGHCPACEERVWGLLGKPGAVWINRTSSYFYQLIPDFQVGRGCCLQFATQIGFSWPMPFHENCSCFQRAIRPGEASLPFVDFASVFAALTVERQQQALGRDGWLLWRAGAVEWSDIALTSCFHLRSLEEIIEHKRLSPQHLVDIGYPGDEAQAIWGRVFTPERLEKEKKLAEAVRKLKEHGYTIRVSTTRKKKST